MAVDEFKVRSEVAEDHRREQKGYPAAPYFADEGQCPQLDQHHVRRKLVFEDQDEVDDADGGENGAFLRTGGSND